VGISEEEQVGDVYVEVAREGGDEVVPLPRGVGSDAVDEKKGSGGVVMGLGGPTMHDGAVAEIGGCGFESGPGEGIPQVPVTPSGEAQTPPTATTHLFTLF